MTHRLGTAALRRTRFSCCGLFALSQVVRENYLQFDPFHWRHRCCLPSCVQSLSSIQRAWDEIVGKIQSSSTPKLPSFLFTQMSMKAFNCFLKEQIIYLFKWVNCGFLTNSISFSKAAVRLLKHEKPIKIFSGSTAKTLQVTSKSSSAQM